MKTKAQGVSKAFEPYDDEEIELILSLVPTHDNVRRLAKSLGRTNDAIYLIYKYAYSGKWLKRDVAAMGAHQNNLLTKLVEAKRDSGMFIGHVPA